jgi:hypothetical protein
MSSELKYINHEKVLLLQEYEQTVSDNREVLFNRAMIALSNKVQIDLEEEVKLMTKVIDNYEQLFKKHDCDLNNEFCKEALNEIKITKKRMSDKFDNPLNMINHVLAMTVNIDHLSLKFRDKFYDNLK